MLQVRFLSRGRSTRGVIPKTVMIEPADTKKRGFMGAVKVDRPVFLCYIKGCEIWAPGAFAGCLTRSLAGSGSGAELTESASLTARRN